MSRLLKPTRSGRSLSVLRALWGVRSFALARTRRGELREGSTTSTLQVVHTLLPARGRHSRGAPLAVSGGSESDRFFCPLTERDGISNVLQMHGAAFPSGRAKPANVPLEPRDVSQGSVRLPTPASSRAGPPGRRRSRGTRSPRRPRRACPCASCRRRSRRGCPAGRAQDRVVQAGRVDDGGCPAVRIEHAAVLLARHLLVDAHRRAEDEPGQASRLHRADDAAGLTYVVDHANDDNPQFVLWPEGLAASGQKPAPRHREA